MSVLTAGHLIAAGQFEDPKNARIIYLAAGGLLLLAVLLGVGTWWWWRTAKVEHPVLGPLEVMSSRRFAKADFTERQRRLEAARVAEQAAAEAAGAPLSATALPDLESVLERNDPPHFDDLAEPAVDAPELAAEPEVEPETAAEPAAEVEVAAEPEPEPEPEVASTDEPVAEAEPEVVAEPEVAVASVPAAPEQLAIPIVVIDTAPPLVAAEATEADESESAPTADDTPSHFDPLLRPRFE